MVVCLPAVAFAGFAPAAFLQVAALLTKQSLLRQQCPESAGCALGAASLAALSSLMLLWFSWELEVSKESPLPPDAVPV